LQRHLAKTYKVCPPCFAAPQDLIGLRNASVSACMALQLPLRILLAKLVFVALYMTGLLFCANGLPVRMTISRIKIFVCLVYDLASL